MSSWKFVNLDKLGILQRGKQTHKPEYDPVLFENGTIPFVQVWCVNESLFVNNIRKHYNEVGLKQSKIFPKGTVCIVNSGSVADSAILEEDSSLCTQLHGFNCFENVSDNRFVKYCFDFQKIKKLCQNMASAVSSSRKLTLDRILKIRFPNPPFELQKKIGQIISTYDLLIENYQRQIEEAKKQTFWAMVHTS